MKFQNVTLDDIITFANSTDRSVEIISKANTLFETIYKYNDRYSPDKVGTEWETVLVYLKNEYNNLRKDEYR